MLVHADLGIFTKIMTVFFFVPGDDTTGSVVVDIASVGVAAGALVEEFWFGAETNDMIHSICKICE